MAYCEKHQMEYIVVCVKCAHGKRNSPKTDTGGSKWQGQKFYTTGG